MRQASHRVVEVEAVGHGHNGVVMSSNTRTVLAICGWCGPLTVIVASIGWLLAGVIPFPLGPGQSADEVASFYAAGVRVPMGLAVASIGLSLVIPLVASIGYIMIRQRTSLLLALVQLVTGTVTAGLLVMSMLIMATAGFRPERSPEVTMALNDLSWLLFLTPVGPFVIQNLAIAAATLSDPTPLFPRWLGFLNLWVGFTFTFDVLAFAFKSGPFAWNGVFIFWLALTTYSIWLFAMGWWLQRLARDATLTVGHRGAAAS